MLKEGQIPEQFPEVARGMIGGINVPF